MSRSYALAPAENHHGYLPSRFSVDGPRFWDSVSNMKPILLAAALLAATPFAGAIAQSTTTFRDERGFVTGRATQQGNTFTFRDERGMVTGRSTQQGNTFTFRDQRGMVTGRSTGSLPPPPRP